MQGALDIADDTFIVAAPEAVAAVVGDRLMWRRWWPDLDLTVTCDRGLEGVQWDLSGALRGSMEIWLEPWGDGVLVHWYLRGTATGSARRLRRQRERRTRAWKAQVHGLKDRLEAGREPGSTRRAAGVKKSGEPAESP